MEIKGIVNIVTKENAKICSVGTGFFVADNIILTCYHVISIANQLPSNVSFKFENSDDIYNSKVLSESKEIDVVLLISEKNFQISFELDKEIKYNTSYKTYGFPKGSKALSPSNPIAEELVRNDTYIKLNNANDICGGFSGAPLISNSGKVVGVVCTTPEEIRQNGSMLEVAHAIPASIILEKFGSVKDLREKYSKNSIYNKRQLIIQYLSNLREGCKQKLQQIHSGVYPLSGDVYSREVSKHYGAEDMDLRMDYETYDEEGEKKTRENDICKCINGTTKKVVLLGEPGCGKSVSLLKLTIEYANRAIEDEDGLIPILIPLGSYKDDITPIEYVKKRMAKDTDYVDVIFNPASCLFIFDALNEVASNKHSDVVEYILSLNRYIVSCRLLDYRREFLSHKDILRIEILDLNLLQIQEAITRNDSFGEDNNLWKALGGSKELVSFWEELCNGGKEQLFWEIPSALSQADFLAIKEEATPYEFDAWQNMHSKGLLSLCRNPMLLRMVYDLYLKNKTVLPENRGQLFEKFTNECLDSELKKISIKEGKTKDELSQLKNNTLEMLTILAQSIISNKQGTGILYQDGYELLTSRFSTQEIGQIEQFAHDASILLIDNDEYRFIHQLHQEYFASRYLYNAFETGKGSGEFFSSPIWWDTTGWEESAVLLAGILKQAKRDEFLIWLADSQPQLVIRCIEKGGISGLSTNTLKVQTKCILQNKWISRINNISEIQKSRIFLGKALDRIGDPRPGVSNTIVNGKDIPEFEWILDSESSILISKFPVTVKQFESFLNASDGYIDKDNWDTLIESQEWHNLHPEKHDLPVLGNAPMVNVSWYEAVAFCKWLKKNNQGNIRLPNEQEWMHFINSCDVNKCDMHEQDLLDLDENEKYVSVGLTPDNPPKTNSISDIGLVWEWCNELFGNQPPILGVINPKSLPTCILKGGSWRYPDAYKTTEYRNRTYASSSAIDVGFRIVKENKQ